MTADGRAGRRSPTTPIHDFKTDVYLKFSTRQYDHPYVVRHWARWCSLRSMLLIVACHTDLPIAREMALPLGANNTWLHHHSCWLPVPGYRFRSSVRLPNQRDPRGVSFAGTCSSDARFLMTLWAEWAGRVRWAIPLENGVASDSQVTCEVSTMWLSLKLIHSLESELQPVCVYL